MVSRPQHNNYHWSSVALIVLAPSLGDFLFGLDLGLSSFAVQSWESLASTPFWVGWLLSSTAAGAFGAGFLLFFVADRIGRRQELRLASLFFVLGGLLQVISSWVLSRNATLWKLVCWALLLLGRWLYGVGVAFALHGATNYVGEMAPSSIKGSLMSLNEVSLLGGILTGYVVGSALAGRSWGDLYATTLPASLLMNILTWMVIPESYRWLQFRGRSDEAAQSLNFLYIDPTPTMATTEDDDECKGEEEHHEVGDSGVDPLLPPPHTRESIPDREVRETTGSETPTQNPTTTQHIIHRAGLCTGGDRVSLLDPKYRKGLRAGLGVVAFLQLTGQPTVLAYAAPILQSAGLSGSSAIWVGVFKIFMSAVALSLVDHQGRKKLLVAGTSIMLTSLLVLASLSALDETHESIVLLAMFGFIGGYQIGFGTVVWMLTLELFPIAIRGPAVALAVQTNFGLHAVVEFCVPLLKEWFGLSALFGVFAVNCILALIFVHRCVIETKGLTLEQIEEKLVAT